MASELSIARLDKLLALADRATPGPYDAKSWERIIKNDLSNDMSLVGISLRFGGGLDKAVEADAAFIAACDPDTIRSLVELARRGIELNTMEEHEEIVQELEDHS